MFAKVKLKGLPKRLRSALTDFQQTSSPRKIASILSSLNDIFNDQKYRCQDLPCIINQKLYRDSTVSLLLRALPFFNQPTLNSASTLLQSTMREFPSCSLPGHLMANRDVLKPFLGYLASPDIVSSVCHILLRTCVKARDFAAFMYEIGVVGSFIQHLAGSNFDRLATAFGTYQVLLMAHPDVSAKFFDRDWAIFHIQFKQLLSSPNYLVQLNFLPILMNFITALDCRFLLLRFLEDVEGLQLVMALLRSTSAKVQNRAYTVFKLFVQNPRRSEPVTSGLRRNRAKLCKFLAGFQIEATSADLKEEKRLVIALIDGLK
jgi:hypothetical protein